MAGFKFKLQRVLDLRQQQEMAKKNELALAERAWRAEKAKYDDLLRVKGEVQAELAGRGRAAFAISELIAYQHYQQRLEKEIARQAVQVRQARATADEKREELVLASQKRRVLEKLREKRAAQFKSAEETAEQNEIDDQSIIAYQRRKKLADAGELAAAADYEAEIWVAGRGG